MDNGKDFILEQLLNKETSKVQLSAFSLILSSSLNNLIGIAKLDFKILSQQSVQNWAPSDSNSPPGFANIHIFPFCLTKRYSRYLVQAAGMNSVLNASSSFLFQWQQRVHKPFLFLYNYA